MKRARLRRIRLGGVAILSALVLTLAGAPPAAAFNSVDFSWAGPDFDGLLGSHDLISRGPLQRFGYRCEALQVVIDANNATDGGALRGDLTYHFTREPIGLQSTEDQLWIASRAALRATGSLLSGQVDQLVWNAEASPGEALRALGQALHTVQDFYSHSNWDDLGGAELAQIERYFILGFGEYEGIGLRLAAFAGLDGACNSDDYAHGPFCPFGQILRPLCTRNSDCAASLRYFASRLIAERATGAFLARVRARVLAHSGYTAPPAEVYRKLLEYGCEEPEEAPPDEDVLPGETATSIDPNEIVGPRGGGIRNAIPGAGPWRYEIHFENLPAAGAAANDVVIFNPLDANRLDARSAWMEGLRLGGRFVEIGRPVASVDTLLDLRPARPCLVRVVGACNSAGDTLTWRFLSIDPATGEAPEDPDAGFLPPNRASPEGEGMVVYTVPPRTRIPDGAIVSNRATVIFDTNASIETNVWTNLVDSTEPLLTGLRVHGVTDTSATLEWGASDATSGVRRCEILAIGADGISRQVASGSVADSVEVGGHLEDVVGFVAIVEDSAGNRRSAPTTVDVPFRWARGASLIGLSSVHVYPSPARARFSVDFMLGKAAGVEFSLYDVAGRRVWSESLPRLAAGRQQLELAPGPSVRPGIYWLRVATPGERRETRVVLLR